MSDTRRYRVCKRCRGSNRIVSDDHGGIAECPDCGHGECAPGVVDAGVPWQSEVPSSGAWRIFNPSQPKEFACIAWFDGDAAAGIGLVNGLPFNERMVSNVERMSRAELVRAAEVGGFQFAPLAIPAPPKE